MLAPRRTGRSASCAARRGALSCFFQKHDAGSFGDMGNMCRSPRKMGRPSPIWTSTTPRGCSPASTSYDRAPRMGRQGRRCRDADRLVFDLDPDEGLGFAAVKGAAVFCAMCCRSGAASSFPMLSGGKGVHVVVPLDRARLGGGQGFRQPLRPRAAQAIRTVHREHEEDRAHRPHLPRLAAQSAGRDRGAALLRPARANAPVAAPITWDELGDTVIPARFTIAMQPCWLSGRRGRGAEGLGQGGSGVARTLAPPPHATDAAAMRCQNDHLPGETLCALSPRSACSSPPRRSAAA